MCSRLLRAFRRNSTTESEVGFARWCAITSGLRFASRWHDPRPSTRLDNFSRKIEPVPWSRSRRVGRFPRACSAPTSKGHASKGTPFVTSCRPSSTKRTLSKRPSTPASDPRLALGPSGLLDQPLLALEFHAHTEALQKKRSSATGNHH